MLLLGYNTINNSIVNYRSQALSLAAATLIPVPATFPKLRVYWALLIPGPGYISSLSGHTETSLQCSSFKTVFLGPFLSDSNLPSSRQIPVASPQHQSCCFTGQTPKMVPVYSPPSTDLTSWGKGTQLPIKISVSHKSQSCSSSASCCRDNSPFKVYYNTFQSNELDSGSLVTM